MEILGISRIFVLGYQARFVKEFILELALWKAEQLQFRNSEI